MRRMVVGAGVALLLSACGGGGGETAAPEATGHGAHEDAALPSDCEDVSGDQGFVLKAVDNDFEPICIGVAPGQDITVENEGAALHSFTYEPVGIDVELKPGATETIEGFGDELTAGEEAQFHCTFHPAMVGYANLVE